MPGGEDRAPGVKFMKKHMEENDWGRMQLREFRVSWDFRWQGECGYDSEQGPSLSITAE
jgi:hypothetical protein